MTDEEKNIFGNQLRERRNELNLTTQKVALDTFISIYANKIPPCMFFYHIFIMIFLQFI